MRAGAEYFSRPSEPAQRRYEALRAYFVDGLAASEVAERFGYSPANVHQMASDLRAGRAAFFRDSKPGPKGPRKTERIRDLECPRGRGHLIAWVCPTRLEGCG